jgi:hypothetical protein
VPTVKLWSDGKVLMIGSAVAVADSCCCLPTIKCEDVNLEATKCHFSSLDGSNPNKRWRTKTTELTDYGDSNFFGACTCQAHLHRTTTETYLRAVDEFGNWCTQSITCVDDGSYYDLTDNVANGCHNTNGLNPGHFPCNFCVSNCISCLPANCCNAAWLSGSPGETFAESACSGDDSGFGGTTCTKDTKITLSDEYTDDQLKDDVIARMPAFTNVFSDDTGCTDPYVTPPFASCNCEAFLNFSSDRLTCSARKFQYKFVYVNNPPNGFTIYWNEHFVPDGGGSPTDTAKSFTFNGSVNESDVYVVDVPTTEGYTVIRNVRITP